MPLPGKLADNWQLRFYDVTKAKRRQSLVKLLKQTGVWGPAAKRLFAILFNIGCDNGLKCQSVVVETQYVDRDYADSYGKLYGRTFHAYKRFPYRLHFFAQPVNSISQLHIASAHLESNRLKMLQSNYLGFCVMRPSEPDTIGRTVILPPCSQDHSCFVLCKEGYGLNLAGIPLTAIGSPFMEQDGMVGACATAAAWMAHMSLYKREGLTTFSTTSITELADAGYPSPERVFPSEGLSIGQIGIALKRMGHETIVGDFELTDSNETRRWLYSYVESGIPVVLGIETPQGPHAITLIGHTLKTPVAEASLLPYLELPGGSLYYLAAEWVEEYVVHDDQRGPYHLAKVIPGKKNSSAFEIKGLPKKPLRNRRFDLLGGVIPLPRHVYLPAEAALQKAIVAFEFIRKETVVPLQFAGDRKIVLRHFLVDSNTFKSSLDADLRGVHPVIVLLQQKAHLPRYIWLTEISTLSLWNTTLENRRTIGEIIMDPSSNPRHWDCFSVHVSGKYWDMRTEDKDLSDMLKRDPIAVPNWAPYKPFSRPSS